jgi:hypothetical protein
MTRVLVCGSRFLDLTHYNVVEQVLCRIHEDSSTGPITCIINGAARGADTLGAMWASKALLPVQEFPANWMDIDAPGAVLIHGPGSRVYNARAGLDRNQRMIDEGKPDLCVAFKRSGLRNSGTKDMIARCVAACIPVYEYVL